jgi:hypothetical protein
MTAQIRERLTYQGEQVALSAEPLWPYLRLTGIDLLGVVTSTALWRGYVGDWEIADDRLYLTSLCGTRGDGSELTLATLFPQFPERVFAHWYSGVLRIAQGNLLKYVHIGFASTYERDLMLQIERGVLVKAEVRHNGSAPDDDARPEGDLAYPTTKALWDPDGRGRT